MQIPWLFPISIFSLTFNKIPWLFPDFCQVWNFPDFSLTAGHPATDFINFSLLAAYGIITITTVLNNSTSLSSVSKIIGGNGVSVTCQFPVRPVDRPLVLAWLIIDCTPLVMYTIWWNDSNRLIAVIILGMAPAKYERWFWVILSVI